MIQLTLIFALRSLRRTHLFELAVVGPGEDDLFRESHSSLKTRKG